LKVQEYMSRQTERMAASLAHFIATTPAERLVWTPEIEGGSPLRGALDQVAECIQVNRLIAAFIEDK